MAANRKTFLRAGIMKTTKQIRGFCLVLVFLALSACTKTQVVNTVPLGSPGTIVPPVMEEYKINVGDKLSVKLFYNPELNQDVIVRQDGRITLQLVNEVKAVGMTPANLSQMLTEKYAKYLAQTPEISVILNTSAAHIFVGGEVGGTGVGTATGGLIGGGAGVRDLLGPTTVLGAITLAGGFSDRADRHQVILVRRGEDNKPLYMSLDIEKAIEGIDPNQDIYVQAYDIIVVPKTGIVDVDVWIDQYIAKTVGVLAPFAWYSTLRP
jgi:protein involved in polysaccharide export with SLBB domain